MEEIFTEKEIRSYAPSSGKLICSLKVSSEEEIDLAFYNAERAFKIWKKFPIEKRISIVKKAGEIIFNQRAEIAEMITEETGKPLMEAFLSDVLATLDCISYYCKNSRKILRPQKLRFSQPFLWGKKVWVEYEPLGVIAVISPWNFPFAIPMSIIVPLLIGGNTVLFKPSEYSSFTGRKINEIFYEAGLPKEVLQTLYGDGNVGANIIKKPVKKVFFTGSSLTGKKIMKECADSIKPVVLELGGKDPMIILKDANLEIAVEGAIWGSLFNCGQTCSSVERILVEEIYEKFKEMLLQRIEKFKKDDIGPVQNQAQLNKIKEHLDDSLKKGAKILKKIEIEKGSLNFEPIILENLDSSMKCWTEETFGPIIKLIPFKDINEAIEIANSPPFGLGASIWSRNIELAKKIANEIEAGIVWINNLIYSYNAMQCPWGGVKESGIGRVHGKWGLLEGVNPKLICADIKTKREFWWFPYEKGKLEILKSGITFLFGKKIFERIRAIPALFKWFFLWR